MVKTDCVEELYVFKRALQGTLKIYENFGKFPADEKVDFVSQMSRTAAPVATNMIEGGYRLNRAEYSQFVGIARGSWEIEILYSMG